jgi:hypothetical protein
MAPNDQGLMMNYPAAATRQSENFTPIFGTKNELIKFKDRNSST